MLIVVVGFAHRRVRLERLKGPQALYAKAMAPDRWTAANHPVIAVPRSADHAYTI